MNGLSLRINPSNKKNKNPIGFAPVVLPKYENKGTNNILFEEFLNSNTSDGQLAVLKNILNFTRDSFDDSIMSFLALLFLQAESKHPVKCFLTRHITRTESLQQPFADKLALEIKCLISNPCTEYTQYAVVVTKMATCIENFPAGSLAVKSVEIELAVYLTNCVQCCVNTLSETKLAPTEKNEIYNLTHLSLRLLLHIVQKLSKDNVGALVLMSEAVIKHIRYLFFDKDSPMDTKSICGILFLSMKILEDGPNSWTAILIPSSRDESISSLLQNEAAQLSLYSAIATVVPVDRLQARLGSEQYALMSVVQKIIDIGWRSSSESTFILGATRTIVQISKMLSKIADPALGLPLTDEILSFVWGHLEHYMDSVRHLTAQALANVVRYCTRLDLLGDPSALERLWAALATLDRARKSYYVCVTSLCAQLGAARLTTRLPRLVRDLVAALSVQPVQASATTALEMLLQKHALEANTELLYETWIVPILEAVASGAPDSAELNILENLLSKAVALDENIVNYILRHIKESSDPAPPSPGAPRCTLLLLSAARASRRAAGAAQEDCELWKGIVGYEVLERAAVDSDEETRILSLSLVAESPKSTEVFTAGDFKFVLHYLRYNINAQSPNFRQLTLSLMKKFIKRVEDSYKALVRTPRDSRYYLSFVERCREFCFDSLLPGANYSRRFVALQVLAWIDAIDLNGTTRLWKEEYIEKLLLHLEDSYENNKALALQILDKCPSELAKSKKYRISLDIESILHQASSMKPTDCVSAAYKLNFVKRKLPEYILEGNTCTSDSEAVLFALMSRLLAELQAQLGVCSRSVAAAARLAPMYGVLHCMGHLMNELDAGAITEDKHWKALIADIIQTCVSVNGSVACVVNNESPEGHLPMDAGGVRVHDYGNSGDVRLKDGRPVTAQMVLLCAWRSVKEVSLLLGSISSRLSIEGEGRESGTLSCRQMALIGEHFTSLLAETKHRGAFEQAYVGFTRLLTRLWRCRGGALHGRPRAWLRAHTRAVRASRAASATRRSAGLPFMIQALVTTELQVQGNPKCLHECMTTLLRLARTTDHAQLSDETDDQNNETTNDYDDMDIASLTSLSINDSSSSGDNKEDSDNDIELSKDNLVETRTHSLNILRALFRNSALEESVAGYVGEGLMVALSGFEGDTWMERNSSTLLFSALMVRIFGVARVRGADTPALRNTMTGRIFFLRYPQMYDFILNKLTEAASSSDERLHPSLYPVLVLLGRLYPSALEGAESSLRLARLLPLVQAAARGGARATRQLAARAAVPLIAHELYFKHIESMLTTISDSTIKRNYCHGILLQLTRLLDKGRPDAADLDSYQGIIDKIEPTLWVLAQAGGDRPCYIIADEYTKIINLIFMKISKFPDSISDTLYTKITDHLLKILFAENMPQIISGRDVCLANLLYMYLVIFNMRRDTINICDLIFKGLDHKSYEVVLSALNYLLILYKSLDISCKFQEHLSRNTQINDLILAEIRKRPEYIKKLCKIFQNNKYQECLQKTLKALTLERDTQKYIVGIKMGTPKTSISDEEIIRKLFDCIQNEHENLTHIYLESLSNFVTRKLENSSISNTLMLDVIRLIFACSSSENSDDTRNVVAGFMENNFNTLIKVNLEDLSEEEKFEFKSLVFGTTVSILEDDDEGIRQHMADVIAVTSHCGRVVPARAAELLRAMVDEDALFVLLALLDFKSEVCMTDEISDECRVFDQNERYNIFLEECVWTVACADKILEICKNKHSPLDFVRCIIENDMYRCALDKLCNINIVTFRKMLDNDTTLVNTVVVNPKIELFINKLRKS